MKSVGRHGKYFWLRLEKDQQPPTVMLMHFGMTGMVKLQNVDSHLIFMENGGDKKVMEQSKELKTEDSATGTVEQELKSKIASKKASKEGKESQEWPPRFTKFELFFSEEPRIKKEDNGEKTLNPVKLAFTDPRRLGRVRVLVGEDISNDEELLKQEPLKSLGPDYSKDPEKSKPLTDFKFGDPDPSLHERPRLSQREFGELILSKKKAIKSILLEQELFAGVGNWVSDEILYHAQIHPNETLSKKLEDPEDPVLKKLYESLIYVMQESVKVEGDVKQFPDHWLMLYRWGKGRKEKAKTKAGHPVDHVTVGGRTSCFVPAVQKPLKKAESKGSQEKVSEESSEPDSKKRKIRSFKNEE